MSQWRRGVRIVQEGSLTVLLFLLPFSIAAVELMFGVLLITWLLQRCDPATRADTLWVQPSLRRVAIALVAFLAVCALSIVVSDQPMLSVSGLVNKWLEYLLFFVIVTDVASRPQVARRSIRVLIYAALFVVFEAVTQERYNYGFFRNFRLDFFRRMTGPYKNPIDLAAYLMVIIPPLLTYTLTRRATLRWPLAVLLAILVGCLGRTEALGAWLGLGIGLLVLLTRRDTRRIVCVLFASVLVSGGFFLTYKGHLSNTLSLSDIGKRDRIAMWTTAVHMVRDRPILGHGVNTFMANYLRYWVGGERQPRYAHNCYLQVAAETGVLGLATFVWLLGLMFLRWWTALPRVPRSDSLLLVGLIGGLAAFVVQSGIDTNFYSVRQAALFWTLAGVAMGLAMRQRSARQPDVSSR